jgi:DNA-binding ferritin-like protein (Dps family)
MSAANSNRLKTQEQVEKRARELGMEYREEFKVINKDVK